MWIEVHGGSVSLWVPSDECRLPNGDLAFANEAWPAPPLPGWFGAPADSTLRESSDMRGMGWPLVEHRSMQGNAGQVLAFHRDVAQRGGLAMAAWLPVGRAGPGFSAENAEYALDLDVHEHGDLAFWTIQLRSRIRRRNKAFSPPLVLVGRNDERVTLRHEFIDEEYWAPVNAVRDSEPQAVEREPFREEPVMWSLLPPWAQFSVDDGSEGQARVRRGENGAEEWDASILSPLEGDPQSAFEFCLDSLDAHGFDASGIQRPNHSYFVSIMPGGHSRNAHIRSEAGDQAIVTVLNTPALFIRYSPSQGVSLPVSAG